MLITDGERRHLFGGKSGVSNPRGTKPIGSTAILLPLAAVTSDRSIKPHSIEQGSIFRFPHNPVIGKDNDPLTTDRQQRHKRSID